MEWRIWIADQIGINLLDMEGYSDRDYSNPKRKKGTIKWETINDDLKYLLNHSDCDGQISPLRCKKIADRLKEIIGDREVPEDRFSSRDKEGWHLWSTKQFMKGCKKAFKNNEPLKFH
jgi:hypothetical protein